VSAEIISHYYLKCRTGTTCSTRIILVLLRRRISQASEGGQQIRRFSFLRREYSVELLVECRGADELMQHAIKDS